MEEHKSAPKTAALADGTIGTPKRIAELKEAAGKPGRKQKVALQTLAVSYYEGCGVDKDYEEAARYLKKAAELGDANMQHLLSICYFEGQGVEKDLEVAVMWSSKAAAKGIADAQYNLGIAFSRGRGAKLNYKTAVHWYSKAAAQGHAQAQYNLGALYKNGEGVTEDLQEAKRLFKLAAKQGCAPSIAVLAGLAREGPNADLDKSNKLLRKAKKASAAETNHKVKRVAQRMVDLNLSNLHCSNEGCIYVLSTNLEDDGTKKGKMKVCVECKRAQYCSKKCQPAFPFCTHLCCGCFYNAVCINSPCCIPAHMA